MNTGEVLAGRVGESYTVIGDTVNVAARLQAAGRPGSVTVGERTRRATAAAIAYDTLDPLDLKGKAERVPAFVATSALAVPPARLRAATEAPLVGRADEVALLESVYGRVEREGRPHLVTLVGAAGVGKSRLLRELEARLCARDTAPTVRQGRCLPYGSSIVFWALGEVVRAECGIVDTDPSEVAWRKLCERLEQLVMDTGERVTKETGLRQAALLARLLGIEAPEALAPSESADPQRTREAFFSVVRWMIEAIAAERPLVLAFEDIHWADDGMLDLIEHLAQWVRGPLLLICLARDELLERRASWGGGRRSATSIFLDPLTPTETRELIASLLPPDAGKPELAHTVAERAGGNPFFAEEMVRRLVEEGASDATALPDTVQALLAARLDSLDRFERRLVQQAAVVGRTFWADALAPVAAAEGRDLDRALTALRDKDIVVPGEGTSLSGEPELAFKHVLIRDVAYGMLPKAVRARKHYEVGGFIEQRAGDRTDEVVALLAEHYARAAALGGEARFDPSELQPIQAKAARFLEAAGDAAAAFYSNPEAFSHYQSARELAADAADRARIGEKQGDVALRLGRVRRGHRGVGGVPRAPPHVRGSRARRRAAPQDRRGAGPQGGAQGGDRAPPEGHQPAQGRAAESRARAPVRGGGVAVHADRRQHAGHLRVREGAASGRAPGGDAGGVAGARDLRARVRPDRRHREGAREPGALGRARARVRRRRDDPRAARARPSPRDLRGRLQRGRGGLSRGARPLGRGRRRPRAGRAARRAGPARRLPGRLGGRAHLVGRQRPPVRARGARGQAVPSLLAARAAALARRRMGRGRAALPARA